MGEAPGTDSIDMTWFYFFNAVDKESANWLSTVVSPSKTIQDLAPLRLRLDAPTKLGRLAGTSENATRHRCRKVGIVFPKIQLCGGKWDKAEVEPLDLDEDIPDGDLECSLAISGKPQIVACDIKQL